MKLSDKIRQALRDIHVNVAIVRMHVAQEMALENEGICITSVLTGVVVTRAPISDVPRTCAGIPLKIDLGVPPTDIIFEDATGGEIGRLTGLALPDGFENQD